jgi:hypothetical protein
VSQFWGNVKGWQKLVLILVVILIATSIIHRPTAVWILAPIMEVARATFQLARDLGGSP